MGCRVVEHLQAGSLLERCSRHEVARNHHSSLGRITRAYLLNSLGNPKDHRSRKALASRPKSACKSRSEVRHDTRLIDSAAKQRRRQAATAEGTRVNPVYPWYLLERALPESALISVHANILEQVTL
jgi:hypothetical protein